MLTNTLNLIQKYEIIVHANLPCKNVLKCSWIRARVCTGKLTLTTDISADNYSRDSCMHKDPDRWASSAPFLQCYRPAAQRLFPSWKWRFGRRSCLIPSKLCRADGLPLLKRMVKACGRFGLSKCPSELNWQFGAHALKSLWSADNSSEWANEELGTTQCNGMTLLKKKKLTCER